ncbi:MAG: prolyl oligopeptidase family serine peptidase [Saprospiraceae bacterium]
MPIEEMSPTQIISYKSEDGLVIPAYLTIPKGSTGKNLPLVVNPHGGPWARDNWGFNSLAQFLANRGYAVLQMNFRGSTGFGKKFIDAGNLQWGDRMQDDISSGVNYLCKKGIAISKQCRNMACDPMREDMQHWQVCASRQSYMPAGYPW